MDLLCVISFAVLNLALSATSQDILEKIDPQRIRSNLEELSRIPHPAGSARDLELVDWIERQFQNFGLDRTQRDEYDLLMSYPDKNKPNEVQLLDSFLSPAFTASYMEKPLRPEDFHPDVLDAFLAFTPAGEVLGDLVYVNYGTEEDLDLLEHQLGVSVKGKIAIARYGKNFRGNKIRSCEARGAIGVILYSDPEDCTFHGTDPEDVYPYTRFLPGSGIQRGGTKVFLSGDPLSPGWPSVKNAYRLPLEEREGLPKIPAQPIGYDDAKVLLEKLDGPEVPSSWTGGLKNITYRLGGQFAPPYQDWKVRISTHNYFDDTRTHINLMGVINGIEEPDRYVILSNHRDAWGFGANDPSGGTAILLELARVMAEEVKLGWRPKRTILFLSWAAEEYGLLGSAEWVFHKMPKLAQRAVAVINVDNPVVGPYFYPRASPTLSSLPVEVTKLVKNPFNESQSYFDFWKTMLNNGTNGDREPESALVGSGSDHDSFTFIAGIPSIYLGLTNDLGTFPGIYINPAYHTAYETFYLVDTIIDPGFLLHKLCAEISVLISLNLADNEIVTFELGRLVDLMNTTLTNFDVSGVSQQLEENGASLRYVKEAVVDLQLAIDNFEERIATADLSDPMVRRRLNDQMILLERIFVAGEGLPGGRQDAKNIIYSHQKYNRYGSSAFPGITDLLEELSALTDPDLIDTKWKEIRRHVSDIMIAIGQSADFLQPFDVV